jgi:hypothetical protein
MFPDGEDLPLFSGTCVRTPSVELPPPPPTYVQPVLVQADEFILVWETGFRSVSRGVLASLLESAGYRNPEMVISACEKDERRYWPAGPFTLYCSDSPARPLHSR